MKIKRIICLCLFICIAFSSSFVSANSAMKQWEGTTSTSSILLDEDCPIEVESEELIFDLVEFPKNYYEEDHDFLSYEGRVSASYTFYNPTDMKVRVWMAFPFGKLPTYSRTNGILSFDMDQYDVLVNDEPIDKQLRYTYSPYYSQFELERDLPRLRDELVKDVFYSPQMMVTKYIFKINNVDSEAYNAATIAFDIDKGNQDTRLYLVNQSGLKIDGDVVRMSSWVDDEDVVLYAFNDPLEVLPKWKVYENGGAEDGEEIEGSVDLVDQVSMSFEDFIFQSWKEDMGISKIDWYNARVDQLNEYLQDNYINDFHFETESFLENLMVWYEYECEIEPKGTINNTVVALMYPSIDLRYEPPVYEYLYLLSPASTWSEFNDLKVVIRTPHYLIDSSLEFEEYEEGYVYTSDGLPEGELAFTLSESSKPEKERRNLFHPMVMVYVVAILLIVGLLIGGIIIWKKAKRR